MVDRLRQRAGLPMPKVAVAPHEQPNAFATGRNPEHAVVAVTTGILKYVPQEELEGVHRARAGPRQEPRHADLHHRRRHRGRDSAICPTCSCSAAAGTTTTGIRSPSSGWPLLGADRRDADPVCHLPPAGVRGRPGRGPDPGPAACRWPTRCVRLDALAHRIPMQVAPAAAPLAQVNPLAAHGGGLAQALQHPPADRGAGGAARSHGAGPLSGPPRAGGLAGLHRPGGGAAGRRPGGAQPPLPRPLAQGGDELERRARRASRCCSACSSCGGRAAQSALEYYTGYLIELSLSVDNLFVFLLIFSYFGVPRRGAAQGAQVGHPGRDRDAAAS